MERPEASARSLRARFRESEGGSSRLRLLEAVAEALSEAARPQAAFEQALLDVSRFLMADGGLVLVQEAGALTVLARHGDVLPVGARLPLGGVLGGVLRASPTVSLREHVDSRLRVGTAGPVAGELLLPLAVRGRPQGVLAMLSERRPLRPSDEDFRSLRALATLMALALPVSTPTVRPRGSRREAQALLAQLTPREQQVFALLPRGLTNAEIAAELGMAAGTAKIHVERILHKLGVSDRTQAAVRASEWGHRA